MKTIFFIPFFSVFVCSCHEYHISAKNKDSYAKRKSEPSYTVIVDHDECTECLDVYLLHGTIGVPNDLKSIFGDTLSRKDILLVGNFPHDLINPNKFFFKPGINFKITGKVIGGDTGNLVWSNAPIFYVEKWEKIKPDR